MRFNRLIGTTSLYIVQTDYNVLSPPSTFKNCLVHYSNFPTIFNFGAVLPPGELIRGPQLLFSSSPIIKKFPKTPQIHPSQEKTHLFVVILNCTMPLLARDKHTITLFENATSQTRYVPKTIRQRCLQSRYRR